MPADPAIHALALRIALGLSGIDPAILTPGEQAGLGIDRAVLDRRRLDRLALCDDYRRLKQTGSFLGAEVMARIAWLETVLRDAWEVKA